MVIEIWHAPVWQLAQWHMRLALSTAGSLRVGMMGSKGHWQSSLTAPGRTWVKMTKVVRGTLTSMAVFDRFECISHPHVFLRIEKIVSAFKWFCDRFVLDNAIYFDICWVLKVKGLIYNYKACVNVRSAKLRSVNWNIILTCKLMFLGKAYVRRWLFFLNVAMSND